MFPRYYEILGVIYSLLTETGSAEVGCVEVGFVGFEEEVFGLVVVVAVFTV